MSYADIYSFESIIEPVIAKLFFGVGITSYTSVGKINDDGNVDTIDPVLYLQRERPRVEVEFTKGADKGHMHLVNDSDPYSAAIYDGFDATLVVALMTDAKPVAHFNYLTMVRYICARIPPLVSLPNHTLHFPIRERGESHSYIPDEGTYLTKVNIGMTFSINRSAWSGLTPMIIELPPPPISFRYAMNNDGSAILNDDGSYALLDK